MTKYFFCAFILLHNLFAFSQPFTDSNLPIVLIETDIDPGTGQPYDIPDDPRVLADMKIIWHTDGTRNYVSDQNNTALLNYNGRISIEKRGTTSQFLDKSPYSLTTLLIDNVSSNNTTLLGMPKENDWILNSLSYDSTLMRDYLAYDMARAMGQYAPRSVYCEVVINGDYRGIYLLMEKVKIDANRVNVQKLTTTDNTAPLVTGGYITKTDRSGATTPQAWTMLSYNGISEFVHDSPDASVITTQQDQYIESVFFSLQAQASLNNENVSSGFPSVIDIPSFVDYMLVNEVMGNVDAYQFSTYFHKDRSGKLRAGPVWDFNLSTGNDLFMFGFDRSITNVWQFDNGDNTGATFWKDLYDNPTFQCYLNKRFQNLSASGEVLSIGAIDDRITETEALLSEAIVREELRWNTMTYHSQQVANMLNWLDDHLIWMGSNLSAGSGCSPTTPKLVISRIHYNPLGNITYASNDLEFIEITHTGTSTADLSGVYFSQPGLNYQFPAGTQAAPGARFLLASNSAAFTNFYGFAPFGQFTRNLSNKGQKLELADAWGNVIDYVEYADSLPWPVNADGTGPWLQLISTDLDNALASSWQEGSGFLGLNQADEAFHFGLYPNPGTNYCFLQLPGLPLEGVYLEDALGREVMRINAHFDEPIDLRSLAADTYFVRMVLQDGRSHVKKFIKMKTL